MAVQNITLGPIIADLLQKASVAEDNAIKAENTATAAENHAADLEAKIPKIVRLAQPALDAANAADAKTAEDEALLAVAIQDHATADVIAKDARARTDKAQIALINYKRDNVPALPELISEEEIVKGVNTRCGFSCYYFSEFP